MAKDARDTKTFRMKLSTIGAALALGALPLAALPACGPPPMSLADMWFARAAESASTGEKLMEQKRWAEAEEALVMAWSVITNARVAYNLGTVEFERGEMTDAAAHLTFALRNWPPQREDLAPLKTLAEQRLSEARSKVGTLILSVNVPDADIFIDRRWVGMSPLNGEIFLTAEKDHHVAAALKGYKTTSMTVSFVKGGLSASIQLTLHPTGSDGSSDPIDPSAPAPDPGNEDIIHARADREGGEQAALSAVHTGDP